MTAEMVELSKPRGRRSFRSVLLLFRKDGQSSAERLDRSNSHDGCCNSKKYSAAKRTKKVASRGHDRHFRSFDGGLRGEHSPKEGRVSPRARCETRQTHVCTV